MDSGGFVAVPVWPIPFCFEEGCLLITFGVSAGGNGSSGQNEDKFS